MFGHGLMAAAATTGSPSWLFIVLIVVMFAFPLLTSRSQKKQQQQRNSMLDALKKGDEIMTVGGFVGKIDKVTEAGFVVKMNPDGIKLEIRKDSILKKMVEEEAAAELEYDYVVEDEEKPEGEETSIEEDSAKKSKKKAE